MSRDDALPSPHCVKCGFKPHEIAEYEEAAAVEEISPDEYVRREEGTYNPNTNSFVCTDCYIKMGMPSSERGWVAR